MFDDQSIILYTLVFGIVVEDKELFLSLVQRRCDLSLYFGTMYSLKVQLLLETLPAASKCRFHLVIRSLLLLIG